jgi:thiamine-phosphate pyrophosphorylase
MKELPADQWRIVDANINRLGEGLRVLEEFARLTLNDVGLTQRLKNLRHKLVNIDADLQKQLIQARDAAGDVGSSMDVEGEEKSRDISGVIIANARRVQESLRVMEEIAKTPQSNLDPEEYRQARFELYTIEKELMGRVLRRDKIKHLSGLYVIIDTAFLRGRRPADLAEQAIRGGANVIQLRAKNSIIRDFLRLANEIRPVCVGYGIPFIINDSLEVALACDADGLNVGEADMPASDARRLLPIDKILGCSANTLDETRAALQNGADYLGVGAVFPTPTKDSKATGLEIIRKIRQITELPIVAIGGINKDNLKSVLAAGADCAAVISAVMDADDIEKATRQLVNIIGGK